MISIQRLNGKRDQEADPTRDKQISAAWSEEENSSRTQSRGEEGQTEREMSRDGGEQAPTLIKFPSDE